MKLEPSRPNGEHDIEIIEPLCAVFRRHLKADGQKYTPERAQILDTIIELDELFEADALLERVKGTGFRVSKATVYRTLKLLEDAGIIERIPFDREQSRYQLVYGKRPDALFVDVSSGEVTTVDAPEIAEIARRICQARGLALEGHRVQIFARRP